jgi:hypothetical protein
LAGTLNHHSTLQKPGSQGRAVAASLDERRNGGCGVGLPRRFERGGRLEMQRRVNPFVTRHVADETFQIAFGIGQLGIFIEVDLCLFDCVISQ